MSRQAVLDLSSASKNIQTNVEVTDTQLVFSSMDRQQEHDVIKSKSSLPVS